MSSGIISHGQRTARKEHVCDYCALPIAAGETYHWWTYSDMGRISTGKGHDECQECWWWLGLASDDMCDPGEFREHELPAYREHRAQQLEANR